MKVCHCGARGTPSEKRVPWPTDWPKINDVDRTPQVMVCGTCDLPAYATAEGTDVLRGPADADHLYGVEGLRDGIWLLYWKTPRGKITTMDYRPYPRRPAMPDPEADREPLLYQLWMLLDAKVDIIKDESEPFNDLIRENQTIAQHQARGLAEGIALIMYPFMESPNAVVKAAVLRHKARQEGIQHYETPGLGEHMFDPHFNHDGTPRVAVARPAPARTAIKAPAKAAPVKQLSDTEKETIRHMLESKMMTPDELAKMFSVPLATIVQLG